MGPTPPRQVHSTMPRNCEAPGKRVSALRARHVGSQVASFIAPSRDRKTLVHRNALIQPIVLIFRVNAGDPD